MIPKKIAYNLKTPPRIPRGTGAGRHGNGWQPGSVLSGLSDEEDEKDTPSINGGLGRPSLYPTPDRSSRMAGRTQRTTQSVIQTPTRTRIEIPDQTLVQTPVQAPTRSIPESPASQALRNLSESVQAVVSPKRPRVLNGQVLSGQVLNGQSQSLRGADALKTPERRIGALMYGSPLSGTIPPGFEGLWKSPGSVATQRSYPSISAWLHDTVLAFPKAPFPANPFLTSTQSPGSIASKYSGGTRDWPHETPSRLPIRIQSISDSPITRESKAQAGTDIVDDYISINNTDFTRLTRWVSGISGIQGAFQEIPANSPLVCTVADPENPNDPGKAEIMSLYPLVVKKWQMSGITQTTWVNDPQLGKCNLLHLAVRYNHIEIAYELIRSGWDPNIETDNNNTCFSLVFQKETRIPISGGKIPGTTGDQVTKVGMLAVLCLSEKKQETNFCSGRLFRTMYQNMGKSKERIDNLNGILTLFPSYTLRMFALENPSVAGLTDPAVKKQKLTEFKDKSKKTPFEELLFAHLQSEYRQCCIKVMQKPEKPSIEPHILKVIQIGKYNETLVVQIYNAYHLTDFADSTRANPAPSTASQSRELDELILVKINRLREEMIEKEANEAIRQIRELTKDEKIAFQTSFYKNDSERIQASSRFISRFDELVNQVGKCVFNQHDISLETRFMTRVIAIKIDALQCLRQRYMHTFIQAIQNELNEENQRHAGNPIKRAVLSECLNHYLKQYRVIFKIAFGSGGESVPGTPSTGRAKSSVVTSGTSFQLKVTGRQSYSGEKQDSKSIISSHIISSHIMSSHIMSSRIMSSRIITPNVFVKEIVDEFKKSLRAYSLELNNRLKKLQSPIKDLHVKEIEEIRKLTQHVQARYQQIDHFGRLRWPNPFSEIEVVYPKPQKPKLPEREWRFFAPSQGPEKPAGPINWVTSTAARQPSGEAVFQQVVQEIHDTRVFEQPLKGFRMWTLILGEWQRLQENYPKQIRPFDLNEAALGDVGTTDEIQCIKKTLYKGLPAGTGIDDWKTFAGITMARCATKYEILDQFNRDIKSVNKSADTKVPTTGAVKKVRPSVITKGGATFSQRSNQIATAYLKIIPNEILPDNYNPYRYFKRLTESLNAPMPVGSKRGDIQPELIKTMQSDIKKYYPEEISPIYKSMALQGVALAYAYRVAPEFIGLAKRMLLDEDRAAITRHSLIAFLHALTSFQTRLVESMGLSTIPYADRTQELENLLEVFSWENLEKIVGEDQVEAVAQVLYDAGVVGVMDEGDGILYPNITATDIGYAQLAAELNHPDLTLSDDQKDMIMGQVSAFFDFYSLTPFPKEKPLEDRLRKPLQEVIAMILDELISFIQRRLVGGFYTPPHEEFNDWLGAFSGMPFEEQLETLNQHTRNAYLQMLVESSSATQ